MKTIAIINRKGGVGKSTVATHLAGSLTIAGARVLLIDSDPQGNAALLLGCRKGPGLYNLLVDSADFQDVCRPVDLAAIAPAGFKTPGQLLVLPSDEKTQVIPLLVKNPFALARRLDEVATAFDYVILDTAPTITMFDGSVMLAADGVIYVTECERLSLDGLQSGLRELREAAPQRAGYQIPAAQILGIVPNKLRENTANHVANLKAVREKFGPLVWEPIPLRTTIAEASNFGKLVFAYAMHSDASTALATLIRRFQEVIHAEKSEG